MTRTLTAGTLPAGLSLSGAGIFSGTPAASGTFTFTAQIIDGAAWSNAKSFNLTILPARPSAPVGVSATCDDAQITLSWSAVDGAANYNIKRTPTSGGNCALLASGVTTPAYADNTVTNGMTYYNVVSAVNGGGEGGTQMKLAPRHQRRLALGRCNLPF
jgi:hypothetical protein